jgi:ABC-2 type transport system permease protein
MLIASLVCSLAPSLKTQTAGVVGNIVTFPMMFLSGTFFPISYMPEYLRNIAHILPLYYVVEGLNNAMVFNNIPGLLFDVGVVAIITVVIFAFAIKPFKWRED